MSTFDEIAMQKCANWAEYLNISIESIFRLSIRGQRHFCWNLIPGNVSTCTSHRFLFQVLKWQSQLQNKLDWSPNFLENSIHNFASNLCHFERKCRTHSDFELKLRQKVVAVQMNGLKHFENRSSGLLCKIHFYICGPTSFWAICKRYFNY